MEGIPRVDAAEPSVDSKNGYGDGVSQALELVVAPVLLSLLGAFLDHELGTGRLLLVIFVIFGFLGAFVTAYYEFQARAARHDQGKPWTRRPR